MRQYQKSAVCLLAASLASGLLTQSASAQFSSSSRTGSTSGNALTSGTTTGGAGGTSGFGATSAAGGAANGTVGGNNAANRAVGNGQATLGQSLFTQGNNQNSFIGGRNQTQGFIGGNQRTGQQQNNRQQQQNNRQFNFGQNDFNNMNGQGQQTQDPKRAIRPQYRIAFDQFPRPTTEILSVVPPRLSSFSQTPALRGVVYELDAEGVVVLRGAVNTPAHKRLAENVVRLEPGVKRVRNELTLNTSTDTP